MARGRCCAPASSAPTSLLRFGLRSADGLLRRSPHAIIHAHIEQPPRRENRVTLSDRLDSLGQSRARLEWRIGAQERDSLLRTLKLFDTALRSQGVGHLARLPDASSFDMLVEQSHHHMGTTRMHADPTQGVVDADCRVHGVANLYVAGSSVMPTGGAATVTLTAVALALRLADHLKTQPQRKSLGRARRSRDDDADAVGVAAEHRYQLRLLELLQAP